jgi:hypothetical protein
MSLPIVDAVKSRLNNTGGQLAKYVEDRLVEEELRKREVIVFEAFAKLQELVGLHSKIRPDDVTYNGDGEKASETYSKKKIDEKMALKKAIEKLDKAINAIFDGTSNDFDALKKASAFQPGSSEDKPQA